jgi:hypothetical protein
MTEDEHATNGPEAERPVTGDPGVDRTLADLEQALGSDEQDAVSALTEAHRRLQARLSDPGPTPLTPG